MSPRYKIVRGKKSQLNDPEYVASAFIGQFGMFDVYKWPATGSVSVRWSNAPGDKLRFSSIRYMEHACQREPALRPILMAAKLTNWFAGNKR